MIRKITIVLATALLFSQANASSIGVNSVGVKLGSQEFGFDITQNGANADVSGSAFAYEISGNYNLLSAEEEKSFGLDAGLRYQGSSDISIAGDDLVFTFFEGGLRPYLSLSGFILFADLGFSYVKAEATSGGASASVSETSFAPGLGAQINFEKLNVRPSLHWLSYADDAFSSNYDLADFVSLTIPVSYSYNDSIDISFSYRHLFGTEFSYSDGANSFSIEPYTNEYLIGLDYKF